MKLRKPLTFTAAFLLTASLAIACSVPVFRYALEHWTPDPFVAVVFHRGELSAEHQQILKTLQPRTETGLPKANLVVRAVDLNGELDETMQALWQQNETDQLPQVVLQAPPKWGPPATVWSGHLTDGNAGRVLDSPVRRDVTKRLLDGDSVVWIYLESGVEEDDDAAFKLLTTEIFRMQSELKLPEIAEEDLEELSVDPASLAIRFSAVRLSRDNAEELMLVNMLLNVEPDLLDEEYVHSPMAFPVFGRGRALYALVGDGIAPDLIEEASQFLSAGCQCTVKAQNPGVDLLMHVDWDASLDPWTTSDEPLPPLAGFSGFVEADGAETETEAATTVAATTVAAAPVVEEHPAAAIVTEKSSSEEYEAADSQHEPAPVESASSEQPGSQMTRSVLILLIAGVMAAIVATFILKPREG